MAPRSPLHGSPRQDERSEPAALVVGLWLTALALTLLFAGEIRSFVVHDRALGARPVVLAAADALVETSERTRASWLAERLSSLAERAKPEVVWLREDEAAAPPRAPAPPARVDPPAPAGDAGVTERAPLLAEVGEPKRVLVIGASSVLLHFGVELERTLRTSYKSVEVTRLGKLATGLVRDDFFDWPATTTELLDKVEPHVVIAQFGGNDAQAISLARRAPLMFATPEWDEEYGRRIEALAELVQSRGARLIILGMPMMREPRFSKRIEHVNAITSARAQKSGASFISTWDLSADPRGEYTNSIRLDGASHLLRSSDGVHFTREGAVYMARKVSEQLEREVVLVPADEDRAVVVRRDIDSKALGRSVSYLAYVPQTAARDGDALPALLLLHGADGSFTDWSDHAHRALQELSSRHEMVIVTPEGGASGWYVDSPLVPNSRYASHIVEEVVADVGATMPVDDRRGIAGLSAGGHGALTLALKHPELFASASSMSGVVDLAAAASREALVERLGPYAESRERWEESSARHLVEARVDVARALPMLITVGASDRWAPENRAFAELLASRGVDHTFEEHAGGHDWPTWTEKLPRHVAWHAEQLRAGAVTPASR
ncbi:MAG: DUF459 domain-containing protein [Labilithrix sp.]|nr:DUF459 domain-containing protein [Labilithrix sp.]